MNLKLLWLAVGANLLISQSAFSSAQQNLNSKPGKPSGAVVRVPECLQRPEFLYQNRTAIDAAQLPKSILIGRKAEHYVEGKKTGIKMYGMQSFTRPKSRVICGTARSLESQSFSSYAPTLINLSEDKSVTNSVWQFHMMATPREFGIWNQQSRLLSNKVGDFSKLSEIEGKVSFFKIGADKYEMVIAKETDESVEYIAVEFDSVSKL